MKARERGGLWDQHVREHLPFIGSLSEGRQHLRKMKLLSHDVTGHRRQPPTRLHLNDDDIRVTLCYE